MKRLCKTLADRLWQISAPISRPMIDKFDQHMIRLFCTASARSETAQSLDLALRSVVRELARLQIQLEVLQQQIDDLDAVVQERSDLKSPLSLVRETG